MNSIVDALTFWPSSTNDTQLNKIISVMTEPKAELCLITKSMRIRRDEAFSSPSTGRARIVTVQECKAIGVGDVNNANEAAWFENKIAAP
jgi:hypothetical protein